MASRGGSAVNSSRERSLSLPRVDGTPWLLGILAAILVSQLASPFLLSLVELTPATAAAAARHALAPVAIGNSLFTATLVTAIVMLVGTPCAYLLARHASSGGTRPVMVLAYVMLLLPPFVGGIVALGVFGTHTLIGSWLVARGARVTAWGIVLLAQVCVSAPYLLIAGRVAFEGVDPSLEHVSLTLGKPPLATFVRISLPLARPWILAAVPLVWLRALSESGTVFAAASQRPAVFVISGVRVLGDVLPTLATVALLFLAIFALTQVFGSRSARQVGPDA